MDEEGLLLQADRLTAQGRSVAGFFTYECGEHFVTLPVRAQMRRRRKPLAWQGVFADAVEFNHQTGSIVKLASRPRS